MLAMRIGMSLSFVTALTSCTHVGATTRTKSVRSIDASRIAPTPVSGRGDVRFRDKRAEVALLATAWSGVRLATLDGATEDTETVDLPLTEKADAVETLLVVGIFDGFTRVGSIRTTSESELIAAAAPFARSKRPVALMRVDDQARLSDVVQAARALSTAGLPVRVLGSISPTEVPPARRWDACPFPAASDAAGIDNAMVVVTVDDDGTGHPGVVHVLRSPGLGFPWAAAVCASQQKFDPTSAPVGTPRFGHGLGIHFTR
jgi:hypothetical protein